METFSSLFLWNPNLQNQGLKRNHTVYFFGIFQYRHYQYNRCSVNMANKLVLLLSLDHCPLDDFSQFSSALLLPFPFHQSLHLLGHLLSSVPWFRAGSCLPLVRAQESAIRAGAGGRWEPPWGGTWPVWVRKWLRESHRLAMWCWSRLQFFCSACLRLSISSTNREARNANLAEVPESLPSLSYLTVPTTS